MKKFFVFSLLIALVIVAVFILRHSTTSRQLEESEFLTLYGNVEIRRVNLGFRVGGRLDRILFEEGDVVEKGQTIAELDKAPYEDALAAAAANVEKAKADYERLQAGNRPQEIEQARATVYERDAGLKVLESDFKRAIKLIDDKVITLQEFETIVARHDEAMARKRLAEETLNLLVEGFRKEDIAVGKAQLSAAQANFKQAQTALADTVLVCPNDGVLLTRIEEVGAVVREGQIVATLSLKNTVWVYVYIPEHELGNVVEGMSAEIYTDSKPKEPYIGHIGSISPEAEFTPKTVQTLELRTNLVFRVRVIVTNPDGGLRQGMPVTVKIKRSTESVLKTSLDFQSPLPWGES